MAASSREQPNFTRAKVERRRARLEESVARHLSQLDTTDRQELAAKVTGLAAEMALSVLAYNLTWVMNIVGTRPLMVAIVA
jgi:hypothetical protein